MEQHESQGNAMNQPVPENIEMSENIVQIESYLEAIRKIVSKDTEVTYAKGCEIKGSSMECTIGESVDRAKLDLPGVQEELIRTIAVAETVFGDVNPGGKLRFQYPVQLGRSQSIICIKSQAGVPTGGEITMM